MTDALIIEHLKNSRYSRVVEGLYGAFPPIRKFIRNNSGSAEDAKDIFQDALVILYGKVRAGNYEIKAPLKTYLFAVAKNCWFQELRRRNKLPATELNNEIEVEFQDNNDEGRLSQATTAFKMLGEKCREL